MTSRLASFNVLHEFADLQQLRATSSTCWPGFQSQPYVAFVPAWTSTAFHLQVRPALDDGVNVGLGVDGSASNDAGSLLHEARLACFLQRSKGDVAGARSEQSVF